MGGFDSKLPHLLVAAPGVATRRQRDNPARFNMVTILLESVVEVTNVVVVPASTCFSNH